MLIAPGQLALQRAEQYGLTYDEFLRQWELEVQTYRRAGSKVQGESDPLRLNLARTLRIQKTYVPPEALLQRLAALPPQRWIVITEPWCGDSAQFLPPLARLAESQPHITLRILRRDQHLDLMDLFLTNGKRSIPKLIALDPEGNVLFTWGPRPTKLHQRFLEERAKGVPKEELQKQLQRWYKEDQFQSFHQDLLALLETL